MFFFNNNHPLLFIPVQYHRLVKWLYQQPSSLSSSLIQVVNPITQPITMKIDEDNFLIWKQHIYVAIHRLGLNGFTSSTLLYPP